MGTTTQTGPGTPQSTPNQCLFLRGYRIALKLPRAHISLITNMTPRDLQAKSDSDIPFGVDSGYFSLDIPRLSSDNWEEPRRIPKPSHVS